MEINFHDTVFKTVLPVSGTLCFQFFVHLSFEGNIQRLDRKVDYRSYYVSLLLTAECLKRVEPESDSRMKKLEMNCIRAADFEVTLWASNRHELRSQKQDP